MMNLLTFIFQTRGSNYHNGLVYSHFLDEKTHYGELVQLLSQPVSALHRLLGIYI